MDVSFFSSWQKEGMKKTKNMKSSLLRHGLTMGLFHVSAKMSMSSQG
jgi:hypothetical protein